MPSLFDQNSSKDIYKQWGSNIFPQISSVSYYLVFSFFSSLVLQSPFSQDKPQYLCGPLTLTPELLKGHMGSWTPWTEEERTEKPYRILIFLIINFLIPAHHSPSFQSFNCSSFASPLAHADSVIQGARAALKTQRYGRDDSSQRATKPKKWPRKNWCLQSERRGQTVGKAALG